MRDREILISKFSNALLKNEGVFFVGSGISFPSTRLNWVGMLQPFANELGIQLTEDDNLPLVAQYIVNYYSGNRGVLVNELFNIFTKTYPLNSYHHFLARTNVSTIWTTNYDTLLEKAFSGFLINVKANDYSIARNTYHSDIEIIKIHGCIERSLDQLVLTQEDYENFFNNRPATSQRLCHDFLERTFLFIGYSYRDPDIQNVMVTARRLAQNTTQRHFMIELKETKDPERITRQELWSKDLKRLGISCLFIDNYDSLQEILDDISRKSRGKTIYVTGSHEKPNPEAKKIGKLLATWDDVILINGQSMGIGNDVVSAFMEESIIMKKDINRNMKFFPNPYAANPSFSNDNSLIPELKKYRAKLLNATQVMVVFDGKMGTEAEVDLAKERNCRIVPVITDLSQKKSLLMNKLLNDVNINNFLIQIDPSYHHKLHNDIVNAEDVIHCLDAILNY